ncbi:MAG: hypothetical protein JXA77_13245 [Bacteroidales bacterium]|nr:hypothetical protein [Bacteroidales bacterium]
MSLFDILKGLEENESAHLGRILILLNEFSGRGKNAEIEGLTKLAKLDFLLRYPLYLEKALCAEGKNLKQAKVKDHERKSVESKMVRFRYGPWDFRYRKFINTLVGMGLVSIRLEGRSYNLSITSKGIDLANKLLDVHSFDDIAERSKVIRRYFNLSGTSLMRFIYKTFPEIGTLQFGEEI